MAVAVVERFKEVMYGLSAGTKKEWPLKPEVAVVERWPLWRGGR